MIKTFYLSDYSPAESFSENDLFILENVLSKIQKKIDSGEILIHGKMGLSSSTHEKIFDFVNGKLYTQGIVGVIKTSIKNQFESAEEIVIVIKSRFDENINKPYFLAKMLKSSNLDISDGISESYFDELFDFLVVGLFKSKFAKAYENGLYKKYINNFQESLKPKGSIIFSQYVKNLSSKKISVPYKFAERSVNNTINRLILMAYDSLKRRFPIQVERLIDSSSIKNDLDILRSELINFAYDSKLNMAEINRPISHPYFSSYEDLRKLCLSILNFDSISPFDQGLGETDAILYYIPDLWENYLEKSLFFSADTNFYVESQAVLKILNSINIRPDFLIRKDGQPFAVLDAKFKPKWSESVVLEDYSKCIRDMNAFNTHITGVIYPTNQQFGQQIQTYKISKYNQKDSFLRISINIPEIKNQQFYEFSAQMDRTISLISNELYYQLTII